MGVRGADSYCIPPGFEPVDVNIKPLKFLIHVSRLIYNLIMSISTKHHQKLTGNKGSGITARAYGKFLDKSQKNGEDASVGSETD